MDDDKEIAPEMKLVADDIQSMKNRLFLSENEGPIIEMYNAIFWQPRKLQNTSMNYVK